MVQSRSDKIMLNVHFKMLLAKVVRHDKIMTFRSSEFNSIVQIYLFLRNMTNTAFRKCVVFWLY